MKKDNSLLNFQNINTGNGYANDLTATTNDRLEKTIKAIVMLNDTYKGENKKTRKTVFNLETTIKKLDKKNGKLQTAIFVLTTVTVITAIIQVWLAFRK